MKAENEQSKINLWDKIEIASMYFFAIIIIPNYIGYRINLLWVKLYLAFTILWLTFRMVRMWRRLG